MFGEWFDFVVRLWKEVIDIYFGFWLSDKIGGNGGVSLNGWYKNDGIVYYGFENIVGGFDYWMK